MPKEKTRRQKLQDQKAKKAKAKMRKELRAKYPDMTEEQLEAQWKLTEAMGLDG